MNNTCQIQSSCKKTKNLKILYYTIHTTRRSQKYSGKPQGSHTYHITSIIQQDGVGISLVVIHILLLPWLQQRLQFFQFLHFM